MGDTWFTEFADELAQAMADARECAAACEQLLEEARGQLKPRPERRLLAALVAPVATSKMLVELVDGAPALLLSCTRACRESALHARGELTELRLPLDTTRADAALAAVAASCGRLLDAAG